MNLRNLLLVAIPSAIYVGHAAMYWHWLIDDAGISIAYAHNLVAGHGLVAQAGADPVEGFSNPLWTLLLALFIATGTFSTYWTIKIVSCVLAATTFAAMLAFCRLTIHERGRANTVFLGASIITAYAPPFVIWTSSGLENGLLAALILSLLTVCAAWSETRSPRLPLAAGIVAGLIGLTRPDGLVYAAAFPLMLAVLLRGNSARKPASSYFAGLLLTLLPYQAFRAIYFGDFVPNTFHAKPGASLLAPLYDVLSGRALMASTNIFNAAIPSIGWVCAVAFVAAPLLYLFLRKSRLKRPMLLLYMFCALALFAYLALPQDWMPHYRFATVLFPLGALFFLVLAGSMLDEASVPMATRALAIGTAVVVALSVNPYMIRAGEFTKKPTTTLAQITNDVALTFNWYREQFGIERASLLSPDLGGALMYSELRIVDLAGLCDKKIGRLIHRDQNALRDYLLTIEKPTFVHVHTVWSQISGLPQDERFLRDYLRLSQTNWVRREAVANIGEETAAAIAATPPAFNVTAAPVFPPLENPRMVGNG